jgi:hypothetical protein
LTSDSAGGESSSDLRRVETGIVKRPGKSAEDLERVVRGWLSAHLEKLLDGVAVVAALIGLGIALHQLRVSNQLAWDYNGGAQCSDYRGEVLELWQSGIRNEAQIKDWFSDESGGADNPYGRTSEHGKAIDDFEANCGSIASFLSRLPASPPAG